MKKNIFLTTLVLFFSLASYAGEIVIPLDFLNDIASGAEFKTDKGFIQNLLIKQVVKNSSISGVKLKDFSVDNLMKYFNEDNIFGKKGSNKLVEPITGAVLEFNSDGKCKKDNCTITVDFNGDKGPNEFWTNSDEPKDKVKFILRRNSDDEIKIITPDFIK